MRVRDFRGCSGARRLGTFVLAITLIITLGPAVAAQPNFIHAEGTHLADAHGDRFAVKGINLGNWLVPEGYMFKFIQARAPKEIAGVIEALVGPEAGVAILG